MAISKILTNATLVTPVGTSARKGDEMGKLLVIENAVIEFDGDTISWVGKAEDYDSRKLSIHKELVTDLEGRVAMPGFVDSHTHLVFGGFRPDEFKWRLNGESYMSIMNRGGGIQSTVNATHRESVEEMADTARWLLSRMNKMGVTSVEIKTGYGLDTETELKMFDVIEHLRESESAYLNIESTFLGAHAVPKEYKGRTSEYVDLIIKEMIPEVKGKATFFDVFTEKNVFEIEDSCRLLSAARDAGFKLKLHADEIVQLGGAELAAEMGAVSADHLLHVSDNGIQRMAENNVVATLLPLTAFALREPYAPARKFIDAGCAVALATDTNPGSCFSGSIPLTIDLACIYMGMTIEETITAMTLNGAAALGMADSTGSIEVGKKADVITLQFDNINMLPYYIGMNMVRDVFHNGLLVRHNELSDL